MEPCPGCSLGWFSGRESGGGKAHLCFFLGQYIPGLRVYSHLFPVKRQGRTCLVLWVLPGLQWQGGFWQLMCDPVLQLCCTLIPGTLCLPSHPFESHLHLQFSLSQSPLRLLNSSEYQNYRGKKICSPETSCYFLLLQPCSVLHTWISENKINSNT